MLNKNAPQFSQGLSVGCESSRANFEWEEKKQDKAKRKKKTEKLQNRPPFMLSLRIP